MIVVFKCSVVKSNTLQTLKQNGTIKLPII